MSPSLMNSTSMAGFLSKKQYAAIVPKAFAIKLLNDRCRECSIWAIFFNSSFTVSISALFLRQILSAILISEFFMLFLTLVYNCIPSTKRLSKSVRYILCHRKVSPWYSLTRPLLWAVPCHPLLLSWIQN